MQNARGNSNSTRVLTLHTNARADLSIPAQSTSDTMYTASDEELHEEETVVRRHLREVRKTDDNWTGYVESEEALKEFERDLACINVSFQTEVSSHTEADKGGISAQIP